MPAAQGTEFMAARLLLGAAWGRALPFDSLLLAWLWLGVFPSVLLDDEAQTEQLGDAKWYRYHSEQHDKSTERQGAHHVGQSPDAGNGGEPAECPHKAVR
jgi:hypothetical protein